MKFTVTKEGWTFKEEKLSDTLFEMELDRSGITDAIYDWLYPTLRDFRDEDENYRPKEIKRVRVRVTVEIEEVKKGKKVGGR